MFLSEIEIQALIDEIEQLNTQSETCSFEQLAAIFTNLKPKHVERFIIIKRSYSTAFSAPEIEKNRYMLGMIRFHLK